MVWVSCVVGSVDTNERPPLLGPRNRVDSSRHAGVATRRASTGRASCVLLRTRADAGAIASAIMPPMFLIGVDVGGTFTDLTAIDETTGRVAVTKVPSARQREA